MCHRALWNTHHVERLKGLRAKARPSGSRKRCDLAPVRMQLSGGGSCPKGLGAGMPANSKIRAVQGDVREISSETQVWKWQCMLGPFCRACMHVSLKLTQCVFLACERRTLRSSRLNVLKQKQLQTGGQRMLHCRCGSFCACACFH